MPPTIEGVDTAPDGQVHVLSEREVVAQVTDVESLGRFLAEVGISRPDLGPELSGKKPSGSSGK